LIGKTIAHYKILEKLGEGGMGVVYKAHDTRLDRTVALKFLPSYVGAGETEKKRFINEARAASTLDHQNICTIYSIEQTDDEQLFIVMAYYEGMSLKEKIEQGPLPIKDVVNYAIQIASGLQKAHEKGIVHRDLKPANIFIANDNQIKIIDFGLAKVVDRTLLTKPGTTLGTVSYMSPEQAQGVTVDHQTDMWSLGVVMYEMITGQRPFKSEYETAIVYSILNEEPAPLISLRSEVPKELVHIVQKAILKNPDERYVDIDMMLSELKSVQEHFEVVEVKDKKEEKKLLPSIAVLPFVNMSTDPDNEYFSDGLAEELINVLTKIKGIRVVARTSAFSFKGKEIDVREIGNKLNVNTVLEGSVRKAGNRLRITVQLINVEDGYYLWSERYDRELADIFAIQDEISLAIVERLKVELLDNEKVDFLRRHTENQKAYHLYLKGRYNLNKRSAKDFQKAIGYFEQTIAEEPNYALAYAGLADTYNLLERYGVMPPDKVLPLAQAAAIKACEIDPTLAEAYCALAYNKMIYNWDWEGSERDFRHAIALNPEYSTAHHWFAWHLVAMGRHSDAMEEIKQAQELDPLSLIINTNVGTLFYFAREYDNAIKQLHRTLEMESGFVVAHQWLARSYEQKLLFSEAIKEHQKSLEILGDDPESLASLAHAYAVSGKRNEAEKIMHVLKILSKERFVSHYWLGLIYAGLGEVEASLKYLEKACEERFDWLLFIKVEPMMDPLRSDRRFTGLLKKLGLA
jgi:eukaryotic-like serine/threonine-protein kinase